MDSDDRAAAGLLANGQSGRGQASGKASGSATKATTPQHFNMNNINNNNGGGSAAEPDAQQQIHHCFRDKQARDKIEAQADELEAVKESWGEQKQQID